MSLPVTDRTFYRLVQGACELGTTVSTHDAAFGPHDSAFGPFTFGKLDTTFGTPDNTFGKKRACAVGTFGKHEPHMVHTIARSVCELGTFGKHVATCGEDDSAFGPYLRQ